MKTAKIIALIMSLVLALSMAACNLGNDGETTPESTPAETTAPTKTVEEVVEVAKTYFSGTNFNMSGTSHTVVTGEEGYDETVNVTAQMVGIGTEDFKLYFATDSEKSGFMKVIYVGGTTYTHMNMMNMELKLKQEQPVDEVMDEYSLDLFPFTASMLLDAKVEYTNETFVLTATGLTKEAFIEFILGESRDYYETDEEYEDALADYTYDNTKDASITIVLSKDGKLVSMTTYESYTYCGVKNTTEDTVNFSSEIPTITAPEDADQYADADEILGNDI